MQGTHRSMCDKWLDAVRILHNDPADGPDDENHGTPWPGKRLVSAATTTVFNHGTICSPVHFAAPLAIGCRAVWHCVCHRSEHTHGACGVHSLIHRRGSSVRTR